MFDDTLVVQSAVSAFNNAALVAPTFFWCGLLSLPLLALAYFCGSDFLKRIGWAPADLIKNSAALTVAVTLIWLISFGGNYNVLRDATSTLPFVVAAIVFTCCVALGYVSRGHALPAWGAAPARRRIGFGIAAIIVLAFVGLSGMHTWWGILMQVAAFAGGLIIGRRARRIPETVAISSFIMLATTTAILMQPEFFRFGQLGNLTIVHLIGLLAVGVFVVAGLVLRNVRPAGRIYHSAFVKLKWMTRFVVALALVLFVMTESVPVFLGALAAMTIMFALSVWHAKVMDARLHEYMYAAALIAFGVLTGLPVISALGVIILTGLPQINFWHAMRFLL